MQTTTPTSHHSVFYRPDALPDAQPTASKHWRQCRLCRFSYAASYLHSLWSVDSCWQCTHIYTFYSPLDCVRDHPGKPVPESTCILLKQKTYANLHITQTDNHTNTLSLSFYRSDAIVPPNQQCQSTEGRQYEILFFICHMAFFTCQAPLYATLCAVTWEMLWCTIISVLWRCWLDSRKGKRAVKIEWWGAV